MGSDNMVWSTYYGGGGHGASSTGYAIEWDDNENLYMAGYASGEDFPTTPGAFQENIDPSIQHNNGVILKFNGNRVLNWATYYGGSLFDQITDLEICDGSLYVIGTTRSNDFPIVSKPNAFNEGTKGNQADIFLAQIIMSTGYPKWSTYIPGDADDHGWGITCSGSSSDKYFIGQAGNGMNTTQLSGAYYQSTYGGGGADALILKLDDQDQVIWKTYYGGNANDFPNTCKLDQNDNLYVLGMTNSSNFPRLDLGGSAFYQDNLAGDHDNFIVKFNSSGARVWSTYLGGSLLDKPALSDGVVITEDGIFYTGTTQSSDFPTVEYSGGYFQNIYGGGIADAIMVGFNHNSDLIWSTYFGGSANENGEAIAADLWGNLFVTGTTTSSDFPKVQLNGAYDQDYMGSTLSELGDVFLSAFNNSLLELKWSTFIGGDDFEVAYSIDVFQSSKLALTGASKSEFPTYPVVDAGNGAFFQSSLNSIVSLVMTEFDLTSIVLGISDYISKFSELKIYPNPTLGNVVIEFSNNAKRIEVYDIRGNLVYVDLQPTSGRVSLETASWNDGMYLVKVIDAEKKCSYGKIICQ